MKENKKSNKIIDFISDQILNINNKPKLEDDNEKRPILADVLNDYDREQEETNANTEKENTNKKEKQEKEPDEDQAHIELYICDDIVDNNPKNEEDISQKNSNENEEIEKKNEEYLRNKTKRENFNEDNKVFQTQKYIMTYKEDYQYFINDDVCHENNELTKNISNIIQKKNIFTKDKDGQLNDDEYISLNSNGRNHNNEVNLAFRNEHDPPPLDEIINTDTIILDGAHTKEILFKHIINS